jgi:hypothetical protein
MIHRISLISNPRIIIPFLLLLAITGGGITLIALVNTTIGVIVLIIAALFFNGVIKVVVPALKSSIETTETSLTYYTGYGAKDSFNFDKVSKAGLVNSNGRRTYLFLFSSDSGKYVSVPDEFTKFEMLVNHVKQFVELEQHTHDGTTPINEYIESLFRSESSTLESDANE